MKLKYLLTIICFLYLSLFTYGQNRDKKAETKITITGMVLSLNKQPVEGASFYIDSVKTSFKSRVDGSYKIKVSPSARKLTVRSPEYGFSETLIDKQTTINFTLNGIADKQELSSGKKPAKPKKMNTYTDIYQMIRNEVSGVVVSGRSVQIQQGHSFFGSSEPLYVVNGNIVSSIDYIAPSEVKSITVLKGSAAAIYGVRGSNGVISITLKNGTEKEK
jgi:TonB-dependent SusC/RagA subfamily outer membrane receptor